MSLQEEIQTMVQEKLSGIPQDIKQELGAFVKRLGESGLAEKAWKVGSKAPDFNLPDARGKTVSLKERLIQGPVVLSFYRGPW